MPSAVVNHVAVLVVLSPSTEGYDTSEKFDSYAEFTTLQEYVPISQTRQRVEVRCRESVEEDS